MADSLKVSNALTCAFSKHGGRYTRPVRFLTPFSGMSWRECARCRREFAEGVRFHGRNGAQVARWRSEVFAEAF